MPTQEEYNVTKQKYRNLYAKIDILNYNFQIVGTLLGSVVGNPSFSNDSTSDVRRTCSIQLYPKDSSFDIKQGGKIWIDKYVQVYIGIYNDDIQDVTYTNMGIYIIDNPSQTYDATQNIITISGLDLMARLTGMRNGNLEGLPYEVPQGSNVKNVLISLIVLFGFTNYIINDYPIPTPYDINIDVGGFAYDIITEILNILPNYQAYFDVNGVFHFEKIPNGVSEQVKVTDDLWKNVLVSYTKDYDYENIKNYIEVLGKVHENIDYDLGTLTTETDSNQKLQYVTTSNFDNINPANIRSFTFGFITPSTILPLDRTILHIKNTTLDNESPIVGILANEKNQIPTLLPNTYYITTGYFYEGGFSVIASTSISPNIAKIDNDNGVIIVTAETTGTNGEMKFSFQLPTSPTINSEINYKLKLNGFGMYYMDLVETSLTNGRNYDVTFVPAGMSTQYAFGNFTFIGGLQAYGIAKETNANSPFYINGTSGTLRIVLSGGEYDNINSDLLAQERANFELYQRCRLQDSVTITCVPIYWLDTNWLISITLPNKNGTETTELYLIKSITTDYGTSSTQTINLMKYYPYYPSI